eukprot:TRINITY_DN3666_c0_g2_i1.p1 TRINITY_DN3666_c0_g2~~TRINITY_DN3666_c0_g2_i1.p1  ORF type:complete len:393 (+),score=40.50 TRINITY_DN3666_c0_g2_i1:124-1179(+)
MKELKLQVKQEFLPVEPTEGSKLPAGVHMFDQQLMVGYWSIFREINLVPGMFSRSDKEMIAAFVSKSNECKFCEGAHSTFASGYGASATDEKALRESSPDFIQNQKLRETVAWFYTANVQSTLEKEVPFNESEAVETIGMSFLYNYVNRVVDIMVSRDEVFPDLPWIIQYLMRMFPILQTLMSWIIKKFVIPMVITPQAGRSSTLHSYDSSMLPDGFEWCQSNPHVATAMVAFIKGIQHLEEEYVPKKSAEVVLKYINEKFDGSPPSISRNWVNKYLEDKAENMSEEEIWAAKYMLLIVASRFQVDELYEKKIAEYYLNEDQRRSMCMWAAFHAAKKIANWQWKALKNVKK